MFCGSEQLTVDQKRILESVFQCRAIRWYGHSERAVLAAEGTHSELYYFWPHYGFVEFGEPDEDGLREVIGTTFDNLAMPLVRYRTGDYVRLAKPDAEREFAWPAVEEIAGRGQEYRELVAVHHRHLGARPALVLGRAPDLARLIDDFARHRIVVGAAARR